MNKNDTVLIQWYFLINISIFIEWYSRNVKRTLLGKIVEQWREKYTSLPSKFIQGILERVPPEFCFCDMLTQPPIFIPIYFFFAVW